MTEQNSHTSVPFIRDQAVQAGIRTLKQVDFELAYLALLTREGLKPLSRWEKPLAEPGWAALTAMGLHVERVHRRLRSGKTFEETIFGKATAHLEIYAQHFRNRPVDKSAETVRIEGYLFGYPPCCIAQYIRQAYAPHDFPVDQQKILFHWSCKGCVITPTLIPHYERIHRLVCDVATTSL
ncbi:MAG TPA: hypothetical protein PLU87_09045 [Sedimentisphaerales bacterium]|nr:hypothetical protein [Sedimentisphaerales bacterium]HRS11130.1 hypothetical protein [Sedimentisphaerales bacterium]HRV47661.1 hypothetical protein [Sedimentisphaerales bacterium]